MSSNKKIIRYVGSLSDDEYYSKDCDVFYVTGLENNQHAVNVLKTIFQKISVYQQQPTDINLDNGSFYIVGYNEGNSDLVSKLGESRFLRKNGLELMFGDENLNIISQQAVEKPFLGEKEFGFGPIEK